MIRATAIVRRPAVKAERVADTLVLDHEARQRRRVALKGEGGLEFLLDLERANVIEDGDAVKLEDGRLVAVKAAPEKLIAITTDNPLRLMKVAWHLGNRHVATEITTEALYIADDHVLAEMVRGLGATAVPVERPFRPERGAYAGHEHGPDCGHDHGHAHADTHDHAHDHQHEHAHGSACGCGSDHHHGHKHDDNHDEHAHHGHAHSHDHA
ncbi:MAG TPA: urease accessory protein UreE [Enterovirga sp.]